MRNPAFTYNIQCANCEGNYIGQTKKRIETRFKEHEGALRKKEKKNSAIAAHCLDEKHKLGGYELLKEVKKRNQLDAWESYFIANGKNLVNTGEPPIRSRLFTLKQQ